MIISEIKSKYLDKAQIVGSVFLLQPQEALHFIDDCVDSGLMLEGIEGFSITSQGAYQPHQEHSNDFHDAGCTRTEFIEKTKVFLFQRLGSGIWFEVIFSEPA